jgi:hypothetical protein
MLFLRDRLALTTKRKYTDEGFLVVPSRISRTGIQQYYARELDLKDREPDEIIKVYRPPEEVFKEESLQSFANKPITDDHPPELVDASNSKKYSVGHSGHEVSEDGMFAATELFVTDAEAVKKIEEGKVELSNGYTSDIVWETGTTPDSGEQYDAIQRNIKGNHIAIVERGRAGNSCRISDKDPENLGDQTKMAVVIIDGVSYEVSEQASQATAKLQKQLADAEKKAKEKDEEMQEKKKEDEENEEKSKKTTDALKAEVDALKEKIPDTKTLDSMIADKMKLVFTAKSIVKDYEWEGKDNETIMKEVVKEKCPSVQMDSVSADYVKARFDMLVEDLKTDNQQSLNDMFKDIASQNTQHTHNDEELDNRPEHVIARDKMMERNRNLWKSEEKK